MILLDTSGLLAGYDSGAPHHTDVVRVLAAPQRRILSPFVLAELDYLISKSAGQQAAMIMLDDVSRGAYDLVPFGAVDVGAARVIIERYADLNLSLADASIIVLAERYGCQDVLTLDQRHFRVVPGPNGQPFRLLPDNNV
ncbi:MAG: PIN domain-containing protein [Chloroflexia bacterium]|nr:PIN domain-containing protein [Chloroflexia bacterium]